MPSYGTGVRGREVIGFAKCTQINDKSQFNAHTYFYQVEILVPATSFEISSLGFQNLLLSMISISTERCRHTTTKQCKVTEVTSSHYDWIKQQQTVQLTCKHYCVNNYGLGSLRCNYGNRLVALSKLTTCYVEWRHTLFGSSSFGSLHFAWTKTSAWNFSSTVLISPIFKNTTRMKTSTWK